MSVANGAAGVVPSLMLKFTVISDLYVAFTVIFEFTVVVLSKSELSAIFTHLSKL